MNLETQKKDQNPPITDHKPWPFEPHDERQQKMQTSVNFWKSEFACFWKAQ